jgi:nucleoside-diphosphate-sugar epimerase
MIIVTGGAGFIGSHIVRRLAQQHSEDETSIVVIDNGSRGSANNLTGLDVSAYVWDIREPIPLMAPEFMPVEDGPHEVIHCAFINGTKNFYERPDEVLDVAVRGMVNILDYCREYEIKNFTLISSSEVARFKPMNTGEIIPLIIPDVYNPRYSYAAGKIISEMMALHCGLFDKLTIVRPFNVYGPGMSKGHVVPDIIEQFKADDSREPIEIKLIGSGDETRSFCYIDDLVDGLIIARERGEHRGIYNIGNPQETTIKHLAEMIGAISGKNFILSFGDSRREGDLPRRRPDISKLAALGYEPKWPLWNGLKATMEQTNVSIASDVQRLESHG